MTAKHLLALLPLLLGSAAACHDEPTFVITFAPQDLTSSAAPRVDQGRSVAVVADAGTSAAVAKDAGSAKTASAAAIACKTTADCAVAPVDCCDCDNGGKQQLVAKARLAAYQKERAARCKGTACVAMVSSDESCGMVAACVAGKCALVAKK